VNRMVWAVEKEAGQGVGGVEDERPVRRKNLAGTDTAIVTPFRDGKVDEPALERLVGRQIRGGVDGIVPVGTTGESPTLS
jgi:hypothetical protein